MGSRAQLFIVMAIIELGAGLVLVGFPAWAIALLLNVPRPSVEAAIVGRIAGAALLAIAVACWLARDDRRSQSQYGLLWGILVYNVGATAVLAIAGSTLPTVAFALWPAVVLHAVMAIWCTLSLLNSS